MIQGYIPFTGANTWPPAATYQWCIRDVEGKLTPMMCSHIVFFAPAFFFLSHCLFPCEFPKLSTILNSWAEKNNASWAATPTRGAFKVVRNLFQMLDLNRLSLQEICLDSVCSLHFPLNFSWILIPQKSYCFGSDPEQGHQTQKIFQLLISHPSSDGNKNWFEGPINPQLITLDRPHIW